jgi:hypothetical protein
MSQFCRACGTNLQPVRVSLERPDSITASAVSARDEIGRAVAEKIREMESSRDLKRVAEDVLPQIEKFLESPEEKRMRRLRAGVVTAAVGLGVAIPSVLLTSAVHTDDATNGLLIVFLLATVTFMLGVGLVLNGLLFSRPKKGMEDHSVDARTQNLLDAGYAPPQLRPGTERPEVFRSQTTSSLSPVAGPSITEHTTHHLKSDR